MPDRKRLILAALAALALSPLATAQAPADPPQAPEPSSPPVAAGPAVGGAAPLFEAPDLNGVRVDVTALVAGRPALLSFWASWCQPCIDEIPRLRGLTRTYRDRGFVVLGVGVREGEETPDKQRLMAARQLVNYPLVFDDGGRYQDTWGLVGLPFNVLIDDEGRIVWQGRLLPDDLDERIRALIVESRRRRGTPQG